jgi:hypothetical protein
VTVVMHRRSAVRAVLVLALAGTLLIGAPPTPATGAPAGVDRAAPESRAAVPGADRRYARRLLYDLHNDLDPHPDRLSGIVLHHLIVNEGVGLGPLIEEEQRRPEGRAAVVDDLFGAVLRRDTDAASREFFVGRLVRIGRQKVMADLLASAEHRTTQGGGTDAGWIDALYRDALGRPADAAGRQYFLGQLQAGRTRGSIASFFTGGTEGRTALVRRLVTELLRRPADAASVSYYAGRLAAGTSVERVIAMIAGSQEYLVKGVEEDVPDADVVLLHGGNVLEYRRLVEYGVEPRSVTVSGLEEDDDLVAIDVRPATGVLYGVTEGGQVVTITPAGVATPLGSPLSDLDDGAELGLAVDPATDVVTVTAGAGVHRIDPDTGDETPRVHHGYEDDDRHRGASPTLSDAAYVADGTAYAVDAGTDAVVTYGDDGRVHTVGPLNADAGPRVGFDVNPDAPGLGYAVLTLPRTGRSLWQVDLATGEPRLLGAGADSVIGLAALADPTRPSSEPAYGITPGATPELRRFTTTDPTPTATWPVTGVAAGTDVVGLDVRPSTGGLYGVGSNGQVYALAVPSGPGTVVATPLGSPLPQFVAADPVGFEVQPTADVARVVNGVRSYRLRFSDGALIGDGTEPGTPGVMVPDFPEDPQPLVIMGSASPQSQRGATPPPATGSGAEVRYHIEQASGGRLLRETVSSPVRIFVIGELFPDTEHVATDVVGFDVAAGFRTTGYALLEVDGGQAIVTIDLASGEARRIVNLTQTPLQVYSAFALA